LVFSWLWWWVLPFCFGYSINLLAHNSVVVGTTNGGVAYSNDGATFTTLLTIVDTLANTGNTLVTGTGTGVGDTLFVATQNGAGAGTLAKWVIGTSTSWNVAAGATFSQPLVGLGYANGILYGINDTANVSYRWITPTTYGIQAAWLSDTFALAGTEDQTNMVNALVMCGCSNTLWARQSVAAPNDILSFSDLLVGAAGIPTPTYPINNVVIPVNSLSGATNPFSFMWTVPTAAAPSATGYSFNVVVYLDQAGTIPYAGSSTVAVAPFSFVTGVVASSLGAGTPFVGTPGVTYYWRVRTAAGVPELGSWSAMQSFSVQQLQAIVPVLSSPGNGSTLPASQNPAFSWNPIGGATSYSFQLSTDPSFATTIYSTTATSAGISLPATVTPLKPGTTYFWRVKALTPAAGEWSTVANFTVAAQTTAPVVTTNPPAPTPTLTVILPPTTTTTIVIPPATTTTTEVNPTYIWAIIIIGAVLVIAVIVLIVRTRRSV
jgi:hypothetical protein